MYRVLGKGGFGEVCACQVSIFNGSIYKQHFLFTDFGQTLGASNGKDVRLQKAGEEANKEAKGRIDGAHREADSAEDQFEICCESRVCL